jgi:DNA uptake protein ComE-like DNA-binding protein
MPSESGEAGHEVARADQRRRWLHNRLWLWLVLPAGFTTWAAFLYIGIRGRRPQWLAWAAVYGGLITGSWLVDAPANASNTAVGLSVVFAIAAWIGGGAHAIAVSGAAARRIDEVRDSGPAAGTTALKAAKKRIRKRAAGRKLLAKRPLLAREVGLGRPDVPGADDYGLVDVNHATAPALRRLPGITDETVEQIVSSRAELGSFSSVEDLGAALSLPPGIVEQMRDIAVFVP